MKKHRFLRLTESNIDNNELVLAVQGLADSLQKMMSDLSKMKIETLSDLVDQIKAQYGLDEAQTFQQETSKLLDDAIAAVTLAQNRVSTEALVLSGDIQSQDVSNDMSNIESSSEEAPAENPSDEDLFGSEEAAPVEAEREFK